MRRRGALLFAIAMVGVAGAWRAAYAGADLGGRFWLTYQQNREPVAQREYFIQHYEAILRDQLFQQNDLRLTFYFDNTDNLADDLTYRRYRGQLDLIHRYYTFNARYTPRQTVTPLEIEPSTESFRNQFSLDIHVPRSPRLRLTYDDRSRYTDETQTTDVRDLRADLQYRYRMLDLRANRWRSESRNGNDLTTDVTGASAQATRALGRSVLASAGYEFALTESDREIGPKNSTTNQVVSGSVSWIYRQKMNALVAGSTRRLSNEYLVETKNRDDNVNLIFTFIPTPHLRPEVSRTYTMTDRNGDRIVTDYASVQVLADGDVWRRTWGRAQITRRVDIDTQGGVLPGHIYLVALRSNLYGGIDLRAELNANESVYDTPLLDRFQTSSVFDLYLIPWPSVAITPHVRYTKFSDELSFTGNDQEYLGLTATYIPRYPRVSFGLDVNRNRVTTGFRRQDTAGSVNMSMFLRGRSTFNVSYGIRETERFRAGAGSVPGTSRANTLNAQGQVWLTRRGSLAIVYTGVDNDPERDTSQFTATFRQDF
jgi:hypothetical protein